MAFMRAEYRWLKDGMAGRWKLEHQPWYITALLSPWFFFISVFPFYSSLPPPPISSRSASRGWSLTLTLGTLWIHSSSVSSLLPIKQSSCNDTQNGHSWQSAAIEEGLLYYRKKKSYYRGATGYWCCVKSFSVFVLCFMSKRACAQWDGRRYDINEVVYKFCPPLGTFFSTTLLLRWLLKNKSRTFVRLCAPRWDLTFL